MTCCSSEVRTIPYSVLVMGDGTEVTLELGADYEGYLGQNQVVEKLKEKFSKVMKLIGETAKDAHDGYKSLPQDFRPNEFELTFGIKLLGESGFGFSKVGGGGSFQVTLRWKD